MMQPHAAPSPMIGYAITAVVVVIALAFRMRGLQRARRLKVEQLWIVPAIYSVFGVVLFAASPPTPLGWLLSAVALLLGAALGWQRGRMMRLTVDPETHAINQQVSPAALIFIVVLIAVRAGLRDVAQSGVGGVHLNALMLTDVLVAMALGLLTVQRLEMYLRARRLLTEARAGAAVST
ncbi:DUF1453 domain-containing protein [Sphingomonas sp. GlSt437]|uniref:DUF1453 domain-containing protein n=2 Tax=Bacteria TaxID=2 RepID=UPI003A870BD7